LTYEALLQSINKKEYKPIYLLHGQESYFIDQLTEKLEKEVLSETDKAFNQTVLYGKDIDAAQLVSTAQRFPMMAPYQVVILKEAQQMKQLDKILSYTEKPSPQTILVIAHKGKTINARSKLVKTVTATGVCFTSKPLYENQVPKWIIDQIKLKGYEFEPEVPRMIAENLGVDLNRIAKEIDKIIINLKDEKTITLKHIEQHAGIRREFNVFELSKALGNKDWAKALKIANYFAQNPKAAPLPLLMGSLYNTYNRLLMIKRLGAKSDNEVMKAVSIGSPYIFKQTKQQAIKFNALQLEATLSLLLEYDLKSKGVDNFDNKPGELIKEMVCRISWL